MPLRLFLIIAAWLLCLAVILEKVPSPHGPFADSDPKKSVAGTDATFFNREVINPGQGLPMVHVASLANLPEGITAAVWYGGSAECRPDVKIYFSEKEPLPGAFWSTPRVIMSRELASRDLSRPVQSLGNAILLSNPDHSISLLFVTIAMGRWSGSQLNACSSTDGGLTWSKARRLTLSPFLNFSELVRNRPLALAGGGWCVPIYQEFLGKFPEILWFSQSKGEISYDKTRIAGGCSTFQPSVVPITPNHAVALLRDYTEAKKIHVSSTDDGGLNWTTPIPTNLPNPDAGISGLALSNGKNGNLLLAYNDSPALRDNLSLALADSTGHLWKKLVTLQNEPGSTFSYPFLMRSENGAIRLAYTCKGKAIVITTFNEAWIDSIRAIASTTAAAKP
jgi:predicted neuraminidase